jgi:hypothetical protein
MKVKLKHEKMKEMENDEDIGSWLKNNVKR